MTSQTALKVLDSGDSLWDIGQLDKATVLLLNRMAKKGMIGKVRAWWPWKLYGTVEKTLYIPITMAQ